MFTLQFIIHRQKLTVFLLYRITNEPYDIQMEIDTITGFQGLPFVFVFILYMYICISLSLSLFLLQMKIRIASSTSKLKNNNVAICWYGHKYHQHSSIYRYGSTFYTHMYEHTVKFFALDFNEQFSNVSNVIII